MPVQLERKITLKAREPGESGREVDATLLWLAGLPEQVHERRGEDVHAEEAQVVAGTQAGHDEALFGFGRGRFFEDVFDLVKPLFGGDEPPADRAVVRQLALVSRLHRGDRTR